MYKRDANNKSDWRLRLAAVEGLKDIDDARAKDVLWRVMISDKVFQVKEAAFRALQAKGEDVGYLPGLEEKFKNYKHPLYDSLRFIAKAELTKSNSNKSTAQTQTITEDAITGRVEELTAKYNIQTMWVGELRGRTLSNSIVIVDEIQNCSASTGQLVLSRLDKDCKVICIGSNRQIDNMYTNKYVNALAKLLKASKATHPNVRLFAGELNKVFRGPIVEFAEEIFK